METESDEEPFGRQVASVNLYDAVCLVDGIVADVPPDVARHLLHAQTDGSVPLLAVIYRGSVPLQKRREINCFIGAAPHLGYLVGTIRAAVDRLDQRARAMFVSAYDQGYADERGRSTDLNPDRQDS